MRTWAYPVAWLILTAAPVVALGALVGGARWSRWLVRTGGGLGLAGLVLAGVAVVNLGVPRTCQRAATGATVEPPIISAATGKGDCYRTAWGQLQLAALAGVGASAIVLLRQARRGGADAAPVVRSR